MSVPLFPFHEFEDSLFEKLCADLLRSQLPLASIELNGRKGQKQHGVDLVAVSTSHFYVIQCKCYEDFKTSDFETEIAAFWKHIDRWKGLCVSHYVLCLAHEIDDTHLIEAWLSARKKARDHKIELLLWSARTLQEMLARQPRLVHSYIRDPNWVNLLLGDNPSRDYDTFASHKLKLSPTEMTVAQWLRTSPFNALAGFCAQPRIQRGPTGDVFLELVELAGKESVASLPTVDRQLQLSIAFAENRSLMSMWQTRRLLGKAIANIVKWLLADGYDHKHIHELSERCSDSIDKMIMLATSFTANARAPVAFGSTTATKLLSFPHPMVRWLIARRWAMLRKVFLNGGLQIDKKAAFDEKDDWLRRRWQFALMQELIGENASELKIGATFKDICDREQGSEIGNRFIRSVVHWVELETDYRLPTAIESVGIRRIKVYGMPEAIDAFEMATDGMSPQALADTMALECLKLDNQTDELAEKTGEGRYGKIEAWVSRAIEIARDESKVKLIKELAVSPDEGVRLAVVKCISPWLVKLHELGLLSETLERFLQDENGWVFREALNTLFSQQYTLEGKRADELIEIASGTFLRLRQAGWPESEFGIQGRLLVSGLGKIQGEKK